MHKITDDVRIKEIRELLPPAHVLRELPASDVASETTFAARQAIHRILRGADDRLLVVIGPCSIHDYKAGMEYAKLLKAQRERLSADLEIVMRVYFEKPRTTVGWKGLINDPFLDNSFKINDGLRLARRILLEVNEQGLPAGTEFLDTITPQYTADLVAWGAIGARTTESQVHRELASGLSCPVGFKNGTDGNVRIALDAKEVAAHPLRVGLSMLVEVDVSHQEGGVLAAEPRPHDVAHTDVFDALSKDADALVNRIVDRNLGRGARVSAGTQAGA